jgi:hypothetical protein
MAARKNKKSSWVTDCGGAVDGFGVAATNLKMGARRVLCGARFLKRRLSDKMLMR